MREIRRLFQVGIMGFAGLFITVGISSLQAQTSAPIAPANPDPAEENGQAELVEAYRTMREQLRSTQTAIVNNRFEAEASARAQTAAVAAKLEAMNAVLAAERKAHQAETDRMRFERENQQAEIQRSNRSVIWVATAFGSAGLAAMLFAALFQWRAIGRMAEVVDRRVALSAPPEYQSLPAPANNPSSKAIALSTQRLMSTIERMEQRIKELEHTPDSSPPSAASKLPVKNPEVLA